MAQQQTHQAQVRDYPHKTQGEIYGNGREQNRKSKGCEKIPNDLTYMQVKSKK